jgi:hypothetical protein
LTPLMVRPEPSTVSMSFQVVPKHGASNSGDDAIFGSDTDGDGVIDTAVTIDDAYTLDDYVPPPWSGREKGPAAPSLGGHLIF